jgi:O-antigen/teichoic acid export membrane protein
LAAVANYLLYPVLSRVFDVRLFGDFTFFMVTLNQTLSVLLAANVISIYIVKKYNHDTSVNYIEAFQKLLLKGFTLIAIPCLLLASFFSDIFNVSSPLIFLFLTVAILVSIPLIVWVGYLQGHKEIVRVGIYSLGTALLKLAITIILSMLFGLYGGIIGIVIGILSGYIILSIYPGSSLPSIKSSLKQTSSESNVFLKSIRTYSIITVICVGVLSYLQSYDITVIKILFDPGTAGLYSGIAIIGNTLYYLTFILIWILLPEISYKTTKHNKKIIKKGILAILLLGLVSIPTIYSLNEIFIGIILGEKYLEFSNLLVFTAVYQLSLGALTLYTFYQLVLRKQSIIILVISVALSALTTSLFFSNSPTDIIKYLILSIWIPSIIYAVIKKFMR